MPVPLVLASASPARLSTLRAAGIEPRVIVSDVDEDAILAGLEDASVSEAALVLARAKAEAVAALTEADGSLVIGCDSILEVDGEAFGKPGTADVARERWRRMRGREGALHTGHWLVDARAAERPAAGETASTTVRFADLTDDEIDAYVATREPLAVAGGFTVDGLGGPFVESIDGDYHAVVGLSLPLLRHLAARLGVGVTELWTRR